MIIHTYIVPDTVPSTVPGALFERVVTMPGMTSLGIWASLYVGSVVVLLFQVSGRPVGFAAVIGSGFLAMAIYVLHRMAPIVNAAMQQRHHQALLQRKTMLFTFGLSSIIACGILFTMEPTYLLLFPIGCVGVTLYGRKTVCDPLRNMVYLKPIAVGFSIAALGWILTSMQWPPYAAIALAVVMTSDAMLCDIPDIAYDSACGCTTLPSKTQEIAVWLLAFVANAMAACFLWYVCETNIGLMILALFPLLFLLRNSDIRIFVDLRLPLVAVLAWAA